MIDFVKRLFYYRTKLPIAPGWILVAFAVGFIGEYNRMKGRGRPREPQKKDFRREIKQFNREIEEQEKK